MWFLPVRLKRTGPLVLEMCVGFPWAWGKMGGFFPAARAGACPVRGHAQGLSPGPGIRSFFRCWWGNPFLKRPERGVQNAVDQRQRWNAGSAPLCPGGTGVICFGTAIVLGVTV